MTTFTLLAPTSRAALLADLEGLWQCFDELVGTLGLDDWSGKHGQHWTFTDVPYHLTYFDLEVIVTAITRGLNVPVNEQILRTEAEQDAWNEIKFTQCPAGTSPEQCLEQMWASRQAIRNVVAGLSEADLDRPVFISSFAQCLDYEQAGQTRLTTVMEFSGIVESGDLREVVPA